jgi:hypothetical protein
MQFKITVLFLFIGIFMWCTKEPSEDQLIASKDLNEQIAIKILKKPIEFAPPKALKSFFKTMKWMCWPVYTVET